MSDETTTDVLAEIDRDLVEIETAVAELAREALQANYPQHVETTTEMLAEIEGQAEPQPVQVREGRWRTRGGTIRNVTTTPEHDERAAKYPWYDAEYDQTWLSNGRYHTGHTESPLDLLDYLGEENKRDIVEYLGPIEQPGKIITPDDVAGQALAGVWDAAKAEQQIAELRSEVHHVQRLLGESRQRSNKWQRLVTDLRTINDAQEKAVRAAGLENTDLQHRLDVVSKEWAEQAATINGLQQQLEAVKAELVAQAETSRRLQIELDAAQQVPTSTDARFEEGWDAGTARAVETIAEWLEPIKAAMDAADNQDELARAGFFAIDTIRHLPHIMRTLTGLTPED